MTPHDCKLLRMRLGYAIPRIAAITGYCAATQCGASGVTCAELRHRGMGILGLSCKRFRTRDCRHAEYGTAIG